jgi:predicted phage terminase large subunit-like protein
MEEEGGSSGKDVISYYQRKVLKGYIVHGDRPTGDKRTRAKPWCAMSQNGNVYLVRGPWNHNFLAEVETFPNGKRDQVDAVSGAYKCLLGGTQSSIEDLVSE